MRQDSAKSGSRTAEGLSGGPGAPGVALVPRLLALAALLLPASLHAQDPTISLARAECLPAQGNGVLRATVENEPPGATLRVYFRRMNPEVEDFYFVEARPTGAGAYEAVLPVPAEEPLATPAEKAGWAAWWRERGSAEFGDRAQVGSAEPRDWLDELPGDELQTWLESLESEPVEYYAALVSAAGEEVAWSDAMRVAEVRSDCEVALGPRQRGVAQNLIVGETAGWQKGEKPFHWQCSGLVTRIDPEGILTADSRCRDGFSSMFASLEDEEEGRGRDIVTGPSAAHPYRQVKVFYGTDRKRSFTGASWSHEGAEEVAFAGERGDEKRIELGTCQVSIPLDHQRGETEGPGVLQREDPVKHVVLLSVSPSSSRAAFVTELKQEVSASAAKAALVFIHGYNVSFEDAARRTAQIAYDLDFEGAPVMYSWPSQAQLKGYTVDEANIRWTVPHLQEFLRLVALESGAEQIHAIAHSMGNRAFTEVLRRFAEETGPDAPRFNQIALVAPDVDGDVFRQEIAPAISRCPGGKCVADRVTLYASKKDKALLLSKELHGHPRAGDLSEGILLAPGVETVDASEVDTSLLAKISLGHSYFADKPTVISDLAEMLAGKSPSSAERRGRLRRERSGELDYWTLRPGD